jgi:hypothetical protein
MIKRLQAFFASAVRKAVEPRFQAAMTDRLLALL